MDKYAIIVAGGEGTRMGGGLPKQFRDLCGRPVVWWSMKAFKDEDPGVNLRLVIHPGFFHEWESLFDSLPEGDKIPHEIVCGGRSRTESVKNGLTGIPRSPESLVAVHDAARPLVDTRLISRGWVAARKHRAAVPAVSVTDSLRELTGTASRAVDRSRFVAVQTPQVFETNLLKDAYELNPEAVYSDDAAAVGEAGVTPVLFEGETRNMKITNPGDLEIAGLLMSRGEWNS